MVPVVNELPQLPGDVELAIDALVQPKDVQVTHVIWDLVFGETMGSMECAIHASKKQELIFHLCESGVHVSSECLETVLNPHGEVADHRGVSLKADIQATHPTTPGSPSNSSLIHASLIHASLIHAPHIVATHHPGLFLTCTPSHFLTPLPLQAMINMLCPNRVLADEAAASLERLCTWNCVHSIGQLVEPVKIDEVAEGNFETCNIPSVAEMCAILLQSKWNVAIDVVRVCSASFIIQKQRCMPEV